MPTENTAKTLKYNFFLHWFSPNKMTSALNFQTSLCHHNMCNVFANKNVNAIISSGCNAFLVLSDKQIGAHFKYFQIKIYVQTASESHDLNMASNSFA